MRVDLSLLIGQPTYRALAAKVEEIIKASADDPVFMSDLLVDAYTAGAAEPLLAALREDKAKRYILRTIRDEWGNELLPGDIVKRRFKKPLKIGPAGDQVPVMSGELNAWKRAGTYDQKRYSYEDHVVDAKGCITVNAEDCEYFLTQFGVHSISGAPISYHTMEHSVDLAPAPNGQKMHVWYYRVKEMTRDMYNALPTLSKAPDDAKRRGHDK